MSMRIHACRPSLAAGGSESSRRHNKFKSAGRAKLCVPMRRPWRYSSKKRDGPSAWGSDAAKRGVGVRVTRGRGGAAAAGSGWGGRTEHGGRGGSWDECAWQARRASAGRQSASARFVPPLFADRTSLRLILSRRAPAVVADAAARAQGHLARRGDLQWGDRARRQLSPRALGSTVDAGSVSSKHACTPRAAHLSELGPPGPASAPERTPVPWAAWLGRHGIAERTHKPRPINARPSLEWGQLGAPLGLLSTCVRSLSMKSVNASTVSPVSGALPTSASSTSTSIGLNGSSNVLHELDAASTSIGLKPLVQSSTPPSPGAAVGMGWGCQVPALAPARRSQLRRLSLAPTVIPQPCQCALNMARGRAATHHEAGQRADLEYR